MKKLMIAGVVGLCAAVTFGLESANVVGYQDIPLNIGYNIFAPTFNGIGQTLDIQDIKVKNVAGDGTDLIWVLDANGIATGETYYWVAGANLGEGIPDMWTSDFSGPVTRPIKSGEGFYFYTEAEDAAINVSGEVKIGPYSKTLSVGYNLTGNFSPVEIDIQNIKLENAAGDGTDLIWVLDANGIATGETYYWVAGANLGEGIPDMWTSDFATPLEKKLAPGEGLYLYTESEGATITLPATINN